MQETILVKLLAFFLRFQTEERVLTVNKSKITGENTFNEDHFEIEINHCFGYFYRFVTSALTLRPRNTYIYIFPALFGVCKFFATFFRFWKLGVNSFCSTLNFE